MRTNRELSGKVALVTGAARGQGRSHCAALAREGANIVALDICADIDTVPYPLGTRADLDDTAEQLRETGVEVIAEVVDVRNLGQLEDVTRQTWDRFGRLDIVVANAGTLGAVAPMWELTEQQFSDQIDVNLTGTWKTLKATVPHMLEAGNGGAVILISSISGMVAEVNIGHYAASKHAVNGLMRTLSAELAPHGIRVNSVNPTNVNTPMIDNPTYNQLFAGGKPGASQRDAVPALTAMNALPIPFVEPADISAAVLYLACDSGRYVTGTTLTVDAGAMNPFKAPHLSSPVN